MLIKEYRIGLPMTVEEYRIAQLYMIQKKSREESSGSGSGVEIKINRPYTDGPGGAGQYTHKIYHIGSHLPGWFRAILPKSALRVEEEAWNAYPYTRTIYRCPFIEKFSLDIETRYLNDGGEEENIFDLNQAELRNRDIDYLDIVKDSISHSDYRKEEDPKIFKSEKTGRGPLSDQWWKEYKDAMKDNHSDKKMMVAYKLCRVEFKYWGMQSKIERFIHDIALRKTMLRAHRQAWSWQDEYSGLTMEDIRRLEHETQLALEERMAAAEEASETGSTKSSRRFSRRKSGSPKKETPPHTPKTENSQESLKTIVSQRTITEEPEGTSTLEDKGPHRVHSKMSLTSGSSSNTRRLSWTSARSRLSDGKDSMKNLAEWRVESIEQLQTSGSDDEFFDAQEDLFNEEVSDPTMYKTSSMEMLMASDEYMEAVSRQDSRDGLGTDSPLETRLKQLKSLQQQSANSSLDAGTPPFSPTLPSNHSQVCKTTILFLVLHGGSVMDTGQEYKVSKHSDITTLKATFDTVLSAHYPAMQGHLAIKMVPCPPVCAQILSMLASVNPYSFDAQSPTVDSVVGANENFPLAAIPLFMTNSQEYSDIVGQVICRVNQAYAEFLRSEEGHGFNGQVCLIADSIGSVLAYDALCKNNPYLSQSSHHGTHDDSASEDDVIHHGNPPPVRNEPQNHSHSNPDLTVTDMSDMPNGPAKIDEVPSVTSKTIIRHASCPSTRRTSTGSQGESSKFDFDVSDFFMLGSPLGLILAYRKMTRTEDKSMSRPQYLDPLMAVFGSSRGYGGAHSDDEEDDILPRPSCHQLYNLFYPSNPCAIRLEPLIQDRFKLIPPTKVPRYQKFPLGDGQSIHVVEAIQSNVTVFVEPPSSSHSHEFPSLERRQSNLSICSQVSGQGDFTTANITAITSRWWGNKRLDYALYYPEALQAFPSVALPYLLHASCWESTDIVAFILRQVIRQDYVYASNQSDMQKEGCQFKPSSPREKWLKRRTTIKLRNVAPNHRANDMIVLEDMPQILTGRFMYGPLDMVSLSGEKVDVHIMTNVSTGEWEYFDTIVTESNGKVTYVIPDDKRLSQGMYPIKMVVRGDHTSMDFFLTVLPPKTETAVFSIDGSFTASVSIMGKDPKVRPGAVDVVRYWQELGYLILYITARPDMQQRKVVAWLAQHNFPHGMVAFMDGLSADPLRQKANYLNKLVQEAKIQINVAYGSSKDVSVYQSVGIPYSDLYIIGKVSRKHQKEVNVISEGYAAHLAALGAMGGARSATGNARMFLRKSCFSLPGQNKQTGKRPVRKTASLPQRHSSIRENSGPTIGVSESGNTVVEPGTPVTGSAIRARGVSPRTKIGITRYDSTS